MGEHTAVLLGVVGNEMGKRNGEVALPIWKMVCVLPGLDLESWSVRCCRGRELVTFTGEG